MNYIEIAVAGATLLQREIITARLAEMGCESFAETDEELLGYIPESGFDPTAIQQLLESEQATSGITFRMTTIPAQNWNEVWESAYDPVIIDGICRIRAPFHEPDPAMRYEILIEPKMSFGTAHHATTSLMISMLLGEEMTGKMVLDMGCGTGVLAILAAMKQAAGVVAIDTDEWAYENATENALRNQTGFIRILRGDAADIPPAGYDMILANINRNVLLTDIPIYSAHLNPGGILLMSGFYTEDIPAIEQRAHSAGLTFILSKETENWAVVKFIK